MGQHFFAVLRLDKTKIIIGCFILALALALIILMIVNVFGITSEQGIDYMVLDYQKVLYEEDYQDDLNTMFPRYFIAGGESYDKSILEKHGVDAVSTDINHFEKVGIYTMKASVSQIKYYQENNIVKIYVDPTEKGFELVTFSKENLMEGAITYYFINSTGETIAMEEDYIYSTPLKWTVLDEGDSYTLTEGLDKFVIVDSEVKPVISSAGYNIEVLQDVDENHICLYIFGGEVLTIQKQDDNIRVYFNEADGYQAISIDTSSLDEGQNFAKFIRDSDLKQVDSISFWVNK